MNNEIPYNWETFLDALRLRFGENIFHDPKATIKELKQVHSMVEYQFQFEELSNQVSSLSEEWLISLFVASLQEYLKCELLLVKRRSYVEAVSMAKLYEQWQAAVHQLQKSSGYKAGSSIDSQPLTSSRNSVTKVNSSAFRGIMLAVGSQ